jgi:hypothetical protein
MSSCNSSTRFSLSSLTNHERPVMLPPGFERLSTKPAETGSGVARETIGMDEVACRAARTHCVATVTMTSTFSLTSSIASDGIVSGLPCATLRT